jgi:crotonobetainyl-CoA:carnitine CoA-transferase CaiB-like acyl-CoA transferase
LRRGTLDLLGCANSRDAIAEAISTWDALTLEDAMARRGLCAARVRTWSEWREHPQGRLVTDLPLVTITGIGSAKPRRHLRAERPLSDVRTLDMTRILAGPVSAKTLASHGANVLHVTAPGQPDSFACSIDTGHGKRSCELDLSYPWDAKRLDELADSCDIVVNGYRPGALEAKGLSPQNLAKRNPGIIYVSISCYGRDGPWRERRGWERLAQAVTGLAINEGSNGRPAALPGAPNDYITGFAAAYGAMTALRRQMEEGGSWLVEASLCQSAAWLARAGLHPPRPPRQLDTTPWRQQRDSMFGRLEYLRPPVRLSATPASWDLPPVLGGYHDASWQAIHRSGCR